MSKQYDIAVIGSGFGGSFFAMIAHRLGHSVILLERGRHPRIVVGESSTPLANLLVEELTIRFDLPNLKPLSKWGSWQRSYPDVACGLKRGFTFYHHDLENPSATAPSRSDQLLVAASPHNEIADTHWWRADFDHLLVRETQKMGIEYLDETELGDVTETDAGLTLTGARQGQPIEIGASFVVDASGPGGFLHRTLGLESLPLADFPATQALYSHFSGVGRLEHQFHRGEEPPYPVDDAAVHHVFDGGWIWVLQFNNGMTSAGAAATDEFAAQWKFADGEDAWRRIVARIPALQEQFKSARAERPFTRISRLSFRSAIVTGKNWAMLPSAAGFVDPLLSTGFPLTLLGIGRLAEIIAEDWKSSRFETRLQEYAEQTDAELLATARLIGSLYATMKDFPTFVSLSLLYFAAASFSETARRLGKAHLASSFLLHEHPSFGPAFHRILSKSRKVKSPPESEELARDVIRAIEPINVAGLGKPERRNWYPVDPEDLIRSAGKVEATEGDILQLLRRCGFRMEVEA